MKVYFLLACIWITCIMTACEKDAVITPKDYPFVLTLFPEVKDSSVLFTAQILDAGTSGILQYGFVWSTHSPPTIQDNFVFLDPPITGDKFQYEVKSGLMEGEFYYVKAYIRTSAYEVYGNNRFFVSRGSSKPGITSFSPDHGPRGTRVTIYGNQFGVNPSALTVKFGSHEAVIDSALDNKLVVIVPVVTENETVSISVESGSQVIYSADSFDIWFPWTHVSTFQNMRIFGYASFEIEGKIYICGGAEFGSNAYMNYVWQYDIPTDHWEVIGNVPGESRVNAIGFSLNGKGYYGLGSQNASITSMYFTDIWEFDPQSAGWSLKTNYPDIPVVFQKAFVANNQVFIGPGSYWDGTNTHMLQHVWNYDPVQNIWTQKANYPGSVSEGMISVSSNHHGFLGLGSQQKTIYEYDPLNDSWTPLPDYPGASTTYNAGFFISSNLYIGLGTNDPVYAENDIWRFDDSQQHWTALQKCPTRLGPLFNIAINNKCYSGLGYYAENFDDEVVGKYIYEFDPTKN